MKRILLSFLLMGCSLKVPPITITNAQTAAEKQMVGEDRELEKEGWMIGSIQSSTNGQNNQEKLAKEDSDPEIRAHRIRLNYLSPEIKKYKAHGILGETPQGYVKLNPLAPSLPTFSNYELPAKKKRVEDVILFLNESRKFIMEKELSIQKKKGKKEDELSKIKQSLAEEYYKTVSIGEYYETVSGRWEKYQ
ncbi:DUF1318 domain-containing protein [Leptospira levettii]|uniref:DUF1318 domain-containing protein n=1 Tax=Leptospira levettii TaxID=2023178 RepID=UPI000C2ABF7F|nr:DUF1318 domain-containing protein [Leptospira levettii]MCG6148134.1 YdbL family protein [Leptospira levettii]PJZ37838.1 DUF1318 domain-containing protein [Leptospira levettii]PJZ87447.1 DUF1318 domain-containing protein [Leptospira levettii]PKA01410.1 DUF1318 domain-containing protein [Leptospira levettii]TGL18514.1 DUF1318 domain-containing protein [Leptospira levettii]